MTDSERIRGILKVSRAEFSRRYSIPVRTLEDWDSGKRTPPVYVVSLLERVVKEDRLRELFREKSKLQMEIEAMDDDK